MSIVRFQFMLEIDINYYIIIKNSKNWFVTQGSKRVSQESVRVEEWRHESASRWVGGGQGSRKWPWDVSPALPF